MPRNPQALFLNLAKKPHAKEVGIQPMEVREGGRVRMRSKEGMGGVERRRGHVFNVYMLEEVMGRYRRNLNFLI